MSLNFSKYSLPAESSMALAGSVLRSFLNSSTINKPVSLILSSASAPARAVIDEAMSDEVRITVIATGFDEIARSRKAIPQQRMAPISAPLGFGVTQEISETPAKSTYSPKAVDEDGEDEENEELDIPAFIRKKMK